MDLPPIRDVEAQTAPTALPPVRPSITFLLILGATLATGYWLFSAGEVPRWGVFAFVMIGWILSLTMHEFGHALMAWFGGDKSVAAKGYLQLDPRKYTEPGLSLLMPVLFVLMGGIGLPGGAVWIQMGSIPNRWARSAVSFAGPAMNMVFAALCLIPVGLDWVNFDDHWSLAIGLAFLGVLQIGAVALNLIPVPGLDGYGILDPHLPADFKAKIRPFSRNGIFIVIGLLWLVPAANEAFWGAVSWGAGLFGVNGDAVGYCGFREFQFWRDASRCN